MDSADPRQCWLWTSEHGQALVCPMDDDTQELLNLICTRIGMIMEDTSAIALTIGACEPSERIAVISELEAASSQIAALTSAARSLLV